MPQPLNSNAPAGPGAIVQSDIAPDPLLQGASEYEYVTLLNPMSVDFYGVVGVTRPVDVPFQVRKDSYTSTVTDNETDVRRNYGLNLKNKDHVGKANITNTIMIPSGKTVNLLGNEAQVICRQLVNEIMQREGNRLMLADAYQRSLVEARVVISRRSINEMLGRGPMSVQEQLQTAVNDLNQQQQVVDAAEPEFPSVNQPNLPIAEQRVVTPPVVNTPEPRKVGGRPKGSKNKG